MDGFDVIAIGVEHESRVVTRMVGPLARRAVVAAAGGERRAVKAVHDRTVPRLECQVDPTGELALRLLAALAGDEQLVKPEILRRFPAQRNAERVQRRRVETLAGRQVLHYQPDVIDQTAAVQPVAFYSGIIARNRWRTSFDNDSA